MSAALLCFGKFHFSISNYFHFTSQKSESNAFSLCTSLKGARAKTFHFSDAGEGILFFTFHFPDSGSPLSLGPDTCWADYTRRVRLYTLLLYMENFCDVCDKYQACTASRIAEYICLKFIFVCSVFYGNCKMAKCICPILLNILVSIDQIYCIEKVFGIQYCIFALH